MKQNEINCLKGLKGFYVTLFREDNVLDADTRILAIFVHKVVVGEDNVLKSKEMRYIYTGQNT